MVAPFCIPALHAYGFFWSSTIMHPVFLFEHQTDDLFGNFMTLWDSWRCHLRLAILSIA